MKNRSDNVTFLNIHACPSSWQDHINCVRIKYAISLASILNDLATEFSEDDEYQLSAEHLKNMWKDFGITEFESRNIYVSFDQGC